MRKFLIFLLIVALGCGALYVYLLRMADTIAPEPVLQEVEVRLDLPR